MCADVTPPTPPRGRIDRILTRVEQKVLSTAGQNKNKTQCHFRAVLQDDRQEDNSSQSDIHRTPPHKPNTDSVKTFTLKNTLQLHREHKEQKVLFLYTGAVQAGIASVLLPVVKVG